MTEPETGDAPPPPTINKPPPVWSISLIWIVPIVAAIIGISLGLRSWINEGPKITISFDTAEGLEASKTEVRYKEVVIGQVKEIVLSKDRTRVRVIVELNKSAENFATEDTQFWVVKPRIGIGGVSGLGTLLSGAYIGADVGTSNQERTDFDGLETPPPVIHGTPGKRFVLYSADLGSLDIGSPVYYRRIQVGHVVAYNLNPDGRSVTIQIFVDAPDDQFVTKDARFWNASGVDVSLNADGFKLNTQSLATVFAGGVAFQPASDSDREPATEGAAFGLNSDVNEAMKQPDGPVVHLVMHFNESMKGLAGDAPVDFHGVTLGTVTSVQLDYDADTHHFPAEVTADIFPQRLGKRVQDRFAKLGPLDDGKFLKQLVDHGLRAQSKRGSLISGQLYISLDFVRNAPKATLDPNVTPIEIPTVPDTFAEVQDQIADIVAKIDAIPFDKLGSQLQKTLGGVNTTLDQLNKELMPEAKGMLQDARKTLDSLSTTVSDDSSLQINTRQTLVEVQRAARSFRELADYLERHPEALIRGKAADNSPSPSGEPKGDKQ